MEKSLEIVNISLKSKKILLNFNILWSLILKILIILEVKVL